MDVHAQGEARERHATKRHGTIGWLARVGVALALLSGCGSGEATNLLLVTLDTTRADHTSVYGYARETTPHLRRLAREGALFERAYAPTATTGPTHASLFTGLYPITHGVVKNGVVLDPSHATLAEQLRDAGYQTAGIAGSFVLSSRFGYRQGFERWDDHFTVEGSSYRADRWEGRPIEGGFDRRADATTDRALRWLESERTGLRPFFLFVHYFDPHAPYDPPASTAGRFPPDGPGETARDVSRYDEEILFTDAELGRLLDGLARLGLAENTLVVVTADHGEGLMAHGAMAHGVHIYEEQVRVPWLVRLPRVIPPGLRVPGPVEILDLAPTVADLLGIDPPGGELGGRSVAAALRAEEKLPPDRPVYLYRRHYRDHQRDGIRARGEKYGIRVGNEKLIDGPAEDTIELYDLARDPEERENQAELRPERVEALRSRLRDWLERYDRREGSTELDLSEDERERLRALGYVE